MSADSVETAIASHNLSKRGAYNSVHRDVWGPREKSMGNPWSPDNPDGTILLRLAENSLLHDEIADFIKEQMTVMPLNHLTYSIGPRGSHRLRRTAATFLNEEFQSHKVCTLDNIFITPGVASAIDALTWAICDEGDGILVPQPFYNGFSFDTLNRSNARIVGVKYTGIDGYSELDDLFCPDFNRKALEVAFRKAENDGITVRALLISNPHNPLGRCYPPETLKEFASFCGKHRIHFISDEIYAKSLFPNDTIPNPTPFVSTLALDLDDIIGPSLTHVLYGASKDFCANGLRLGFVCTNNEGIIGAMSSISMFSWSPHVLQDVWAAMLEDKQWMRTFMLKKTKMMVEHYNIATSFLQEQGLSYFASNAGLFIWIDLRHLIVSKSIQNANYATLTATSPDADSYIQRELQILDICSKNGVMIAPGHVYMPEEFGWFRITFTVGKEALVEGLNRLRRSLQEIESSFQQSE